MADDIVAMSLTCSQCGHTVQNDMPEIRGVFEFMDALRKRGWFISETHWYREPRKCDRCASYS